MKQLSILILLLLSVGCSKNVSVSGLILYEDKPAPNIAVLWEPDGGTATVSASGLAVTDSQGKFSVRSTGTEERNGIEPGEYIVMMGWKDPSAENSDVPTEKTQVIKSPYQFPDKLTNHDFIVKVPSGGIKDLVFRITPQKVTYEPQQ